MPKRYIGALFMALAASIWGGMYVVSKVVLVSVEPLALVWLRYVVALSALVVAILVTRQSWRIPWRDVPVVAAIGIIGYGISIWTQFLGTKLANAQMGSVITSATPAFMVVFGRLILGERITKRRAVSVVLATLGVLLIVGFGRMSRSYVLGGATLFVAALTWALMSVLVKRVRPEHSQLVVTTYAILTATVFLTPLAIGQLHNVSQVLATPTIWGGILYLGIVSTAAAFFLWNKGLQLVDAGSGGLYFFFQPLVGTLLGWAVLGEQLGVGFWLGGVLIAVGVLMVIRE